MSSMYVAQETGRRLTAGVEKFNNSFLPEDGSRAGVMSLGNGALIAKLRREQGWKSRVFPSPFNLRWTLALVKKWEWKP